jgi:polar amino acid transport system substrate-binding protein
MQPAHLFRPAHRIAAALGAVLCTLAGVAHADATLDRIHQRSKVTIGVLANGGPFGSIDPATQQLVGWNPELARDLAKRLGVEAELVQVQPANRVQFLQSGKVDLLIASMEYNADRGEILGYAPTPFYRVGGTAAVLKTSGIAKWEDLRGKTVCASQGSSFVKPLQEQYGAQVRGFKTSSESLLALRGNNCVAAVHDATLIHPLLRGNAEWAAYAAPIADEIAPGGLDPQGRGRHHHGGGQGGAAMAPQRLADRHREASGHHARAAAAARAAGQVQGRALIR